MKLDTLTLCFVICFCLSIGLFKIVQNDYAVKKAKLNNRPGESVSKKNTLEFHLTKQKGLQKRELAVQKLQQQQEKENNDKKKPPPKPISIEKKSSKRLRKKVKIDLDLNLPPEYKINTTEQVTMDRWGFDLNKSNRLPLSRTLPDVREPACLRSYDSQKTIQSGKRTSVILIFYDEPLSTLLRNIVALLNLTPWPLLGEILLINDFSSLSQLKLLPDYLKQIEQKISMHTEEDKKPLIRYIHMDKHLGIVSARNKGAKEALFDILVFMDSHAEVSPEWLPPLMDPIIEDRKLVLVPHIRGIDVHSLQMDEGRFSPWQGAFNWRLSFTIRPYSYPTAEAAVDNSGLIATAVMPGGLFSIDRQYFHALGGYDPGILYYGGEHMDLSFRTWMCGGAIKVQPCSNIGHIYRQFNRFAVDPHLRDQPLTFLDTNDVRVAEVWMDQYKQIFYETRGLEGHPYGDVSERRALRQRLHCHSFQWFLDTVVPRPFFIPDIDPEYSGVLQTSRNANANANANAAALLCVDTMQRKFGPTGMYPCHGQQTQRWRVTRLTADMIAAANANASTSGSHAQSSSENMDNDSPLTRLLLKERNHEKKESSVVVVGLIHNDDRCLDHSLHMSECLQQHSGAPQQQREQLIMYQVFVIQAVSMQQENGFLGQKNNKTTVCTIRTTIEPVLCLTAVSSVNQSPTLSKCKKNKQSQLWHFGPLE